MPFLTPLSFRFDVRSAGVRVFPRMLSAGVFLGAGLLVLSGFSGCNGTRGKNGTHADASAAAVGQPAGLRWAKTVEWSRIPATAGDRGSGVNVTVSEPWKGARAPLQYTLRSFDAASPETSRSTQTPSSSEEVILPARRVACLAAVHAGFLQALGAGDRIVAIDAKSHMHDASVRAGVDAGRIVEVGSGAQLNVERLLAAKPDLVLANAVGASENQALDRLRRAGVPVLITAEWMETHPLARAEWMRLFGLLLGREARADSMFAAVEESYLHLAERARNMQEKPSVLVGGPFRDQWFVPGGRSYMARLLEDAGGSYLWSTDTTAGGVPQSFEAVLAQARGAAIWLHPGDWRTVAEGKRQDTRFAGFDAFRRGDVYNNDARRRDDGANDYWETGVARPDRVLSDLISIFHGSEDSLYYYRRLPP